jgi:heme exporter protein B
MKSSPHVPSDRTAAPETGRRSGAARRTGGAFAVLRAAWIIAGKDLRIEARTGEILITTGLFALLVTVLTSLSFYVDRAESLRVAPGVLWITIAFAGMLAMGRSFARERELDAMRALWLAPIPRAGIYLGKALGTLLFLAVVEVLLVALVGLFFHIDLGPILLPLGALLLLGTLGFVAAGTLFSALGLRTRARDLAVSVIVFPLVAPALLSAVVATRELMGGAPTEEIVAWLRILAAFDILFIAAGLALFEPLTVD